MSALLELLASLQDFLNTGGDVLWCILAASVCLWTLIAERYLFFKWTYPDLKQQCLAQWERRTDKSSAHALYIRECLISEVKLGMSAMLPIISMLVKMCPLLGLLGTVTGMIHVFDVMSVTGSSNARAMASGVSQATIPTMAGMMIAIGGLYFSRQLETRVSEETHHLIDLLKYQ